MSRFCIQAKEEYLLVKDMESNESLLSFEVESMFRKAINSESVRQRWQTAY